MARKRVLVVDDLTPMVAGLLRESFDVVGSYRVDGRNMESSKGLHKDKPGLRPLLC